MKSSPHGTWVVRLALGLLPLWLLACGSGSEGSGTAGAAGAGTAGTSGAAGGPAGRGGATGSGGGLAGSTGSGGGLAGSGGSGGTTGAAGRGGTGGLAGTAGRGGAAGSGTGGGVAGTGGSAGASGRGGAAGGTTGSGGSQCPASATAAPGNTNKTVSAGGMSRTYILHVPPNYTGRAPVPVVIDFHPLGGSGMSQMNGNNWRSVADTMGFIMVYPNGVGNSWNVGRCCNPAQQQNVDDVAFTRAIINQLKTDACIDAKRVYATGCSNGGGMSYKAACDAADVIAAVAPVDFDCITGSTSNPSCAMCSPPRGITEIQFRGTNDSAVPYNGGNTPVVAGLVFPGAMSNFTSWSQINMCTGSAQALPNHSACQAYETCGDGAETILCTVQNGTHCGSYSSFGIVNIAWEIFQKHALP